MQTKFLMNERKEGNSLIFSSHTLKIMVCVPHVGDHCFRSFRGKRERKNLPLRRICRSFKIWGVGKGRVWEAYSLWVPRLIRITITITFSSILVPL